MSVTRPWGVAFRMWWSFPVGEAPFTVEADKKLQGVHPPAPRRKAKCVADGNLHPLLCAVSARLLSGTGVELPKLPLDEWLAELSWAVRRRRTTGLSPLRFACIASRRDLVAQLLEQGADASAA